MDLLTSSSSGVFQLCLWPLMAPDYLGGGLPYLSSALWCQYPLIWDVVYWKLLRLVNFSRSYKKKKTVREAAAICPRPMQVVTGYIHHARIWVRHKLHVHIGLNWTANQSGLVTLTFDLESGIQVTCDVSYLCAFLGLCSQLRPNVRNSRTSDAHHWLMPPP